jgi:hypothetical protein
VLRHVQFLLPAVGFGDQNVTMPLRRLIKDNRTGYNFREGFDGMRLGDGASSMRLGSSRDGSTLLKYVVRILPFSIQHQLNRMR